MRPPTGEAIAARSPRRVNISRIAGLVGCLFLIPSLASADVYRCSDAGKTVYSDKPCAGDMTRVPPPAAPAVPARSGPVDLQNEAGMGRIAVGMTPTQVEEAWGKPAETHTDKDPQGKTTQRWTYIRQGDATDLFIRNGAVTKIGEPRVLATHSALRDEPPRTTAAEVEKELWANEEQERLAKADERRFIGLGTPQADVQLRIGAPALTKVVNPVWGAGTYWIYPPTPSDPQTTTVIRFNRDGGLVISVNRVVEP